MTRIFIATGGTGGHIIPARCLALELGKSGDRVFVLADAKYKNYIAKTDDFKSLIINSSQAKIGIFGKIYAVFKIGVGCAQSFYYFLRFWPKYVYGFGGYATFPVLIAAVILRKKIILHEQNAHFGKVNRFFARFAYKIAVTFEKTDAISPKLQNKVEFTGNPVREEILKLNQVEYRLPQENKMKQRDKMGYENLILANEFDDYKQYLENKESFNILVLGGSGGAQIFSEILPKALYNLSESIKNEIQITQQCRKDLVDATFKEYNDFNMNITVSHFFEEMDEEIAQAHLIIARSGSSSLAEFCVAKKPMILVPFARSADDHQLKNAKFFAKKGAAILLEEKNFTINKISKMVNDLVVNKEKLIKMSQNCQKIAILDATQKLAKLSQK